MSRRVNGRLRAVSGMELLAQEMGVDIAGAKPMHVYAIAPRNDGLWGVWCYGCSAEAKDYVFPCKVIPERLNEKRPPAVLAAPSQLLEMQKAVEQLHTAQGALAHIAEQLGLWDDGQDTLNTEDIYAAIDRQMTLIDNEFGPTGGDKR